MQKKIFEILVQTALTVGLFWTILKLTPKSALLSFTILYCFFNFKKTSFFSSEFSLRPRGVMDKAVGYGAEGPWFNPCLGKFFFQF